MFSHPLAPLGFTEDRAAELAAFGDPALEPGRVVRIDRGLATVLASDGEHRLPTRPRLTPTVGDWVALRIGEGLASILPRRTELVRRAGDRRDERQVVAANVDRILIARALDLAISLTRIEALLAIAWESGAEPLVLLTKADRCADIEAARAEVAAVAYDVRVLCLSVPDGTGVEELRDAVSGRTVVLLGESGAGKSTIANLLAGREQLATGPVRDDGQGRHTTTHRELVALPGGGAIIDSPGIREAAYWGTGDGISRTFGDLEELAMACRFSDCGHCSEPGCALRAAVAAGSLDDARIEAWRHALRERAWLAQRLDKRAASEERSRWKRQSRSLRRDTW